MRLQALLGSPPGLENRELFFHALMAGAEAPPRHAEHPDTVSACKDSVTGNRDLVLGDGRISAGSTIPVEPQVTTDGAMTQR